MLLKVCFIIDLYLVISAFSGLFVNLNSFVLCSILFFNSSYLVLLIKQVPMFLSASSIMLSMSTGGASRLKAVKMRVSWAVFS